MSRNFARRLPTLAAITGLSLAAIVPSAYAEEPQTTSPEQAVDDDDARAREHYRRGERYYAEGDYEGAIAEFQKAYDLSGRPKLLFNLANAHERLANYEEAIELLKSYAKTVPSYEHDAITRRIRNIEKRADEKAQRRTEIPATAGRPQEALVPSADESAPAAKVQPRRETTSPTLGWVLVGTGFAIAAGGAASGYLALQARDDADALCERGLCPENAQGALDDDKLYSLMSDVGIGLGAATALTGLFMVWQHDGKSERQPVAASIQSNGFNVSYSGSF